MRRILPEKYNKVKSMVRERLNKTSEVVVTTDMKLMPVTLLLLVPNCSYSL